MRQLLNECTGVIALEGASEQAYALLCSLFQYRPPPRMVHAVEGMFHVPSPVAGDRHWPLSGIKCLSGV